MEPVNCADGDYPSGIDRSGQIEGCIHVASRDTAHVIPADMPQVLFAFFVIYLVGVWVGSLIGRIWGK